MEDIIKNMYTIIREANIKDIKIIMMLLKLNSDTFMKSEFSSARKNITELIKKKDKNNNFYVTTINNDIVGCCGYSYQYDTYNVYSLNWLAINPNYKRQGIATELYNYIETIIKKLNGRLIILNAGSNEINKYLYKKVGFKISGHIPKYYSKEKDLIWYYKNINEKTNIEDET